MKLLVFALIASAHALAEVKIPHGLWQLGNNGYYPNKAIVVDKDERKLYIWENESNSLKVLASYDSDQGKQQGPKQSQGDMKTPEGIYFFDGMLEGKNLDFNTYGVRAFTTDYPNFFDKREGKTGYGIWLHAIPDTMNLDRGSRGCVVVTNKSILDISKNISLNKTPIIIADKIKYLDQASFNREKAIVHNFLKNWHSNWASKNIDQYMTAYADSFKAMKMNKEQWRAHKSKLSNTYANISVSLSDPVVYEVQNKIVVRLLQHYRSDLHEDFGEKYLYLERQNGELKILTEEWKALGREIVLAELSQSKTFNPKTEKLSLLR